MYIHVQVCVAHTENTPDSIHDTNSSCRDWLLVRLARHDWRKLMSYTSRCRSIFCRCCALATLDDTLPQSSVVGYMCKTIRIVTGAITTSSDTCLCMVKYSEEYSTTVSEGSHKLAWPYVHLPANNEYVRPQFNFITD